MCEGSMHLNYGCCFTPVTFCGQAAVLDLGQNGSGGEPTHTIRISLSQYSAIRT